MDYRWAPGVIPRVRDGNKFRRRPVFQRAIRRSPDSARRYMFDTGFGQNPTLERDLRCLSDWQRRYLPNIHSPLGQQILAWLIRNRDQPKPFSHLLISTSFSPTSVRHLLNQFAVLGLVEVRKAPVTRRRGEIVATPKLKERLEEYTERIRGIVSHHRGIGLNSSQSGAIQNMLLSK
jgi:DNA-binding MarR family transcriptional regulator